MLTFVSVPKAFRGESRTIQRNAIQSWIRLRPTCEIILFGDDPGVKDIATEMGVLHWPSIDKTEMGTPLLNSVLLQADKLASFPVICYINADIMLLNGFLSTVSEALQLHPRCLLVGQRINLDVREAVDFSHGWEQKLFEQAKVRGVLAGPQCLDYFVFPRSFWNSVPPFAIGRTMWDQWILYRARSQGTPVIDATACITAIHQNHSYGHVPGGKDEVWKGREARKNLELAGGFKHASGLRDATHRFTRDGIKRRLVPYDLRRCLLLPITTHRLARPFVRLTKSALGRTSDW